MFVPVNSILQTGPGLLFDRVVVEITELTLQFFARKELIADLNDIGGESSLQSRKTVLREVLEFPRMFSFT